MRSLFIIPFYMICAISFCCAQITKFPTKEDNPIWLYSYNEYKFDKDVGIQPTGKYIYKIYGFKGDSVIQEKVYDKLYLLNDTLFSENDKYIGGIRNEGNKIYFIEENNTEFLLYDFSAPFEEKDMIKIGERYSIDGYHENILSIVQEIGVLNDYRQYKLLSSDTDYYGSWVENIGSEYDLINNLVVDADCELCINEKGLRCLKTNEKMSYPLGKSDCFRTYYQTDRTFFNQDLTLSSYYLSPNPVKDILTLTLPSANNEIKIFDLQGKLWLQQKVGFSAEVNVSMLPMGTYMLVVNGESYKFIKN